VRIERLTLAGFKSFGERTTVEFAPGVTAVVGPNGSGKSNILDALRWATGGGRAREFRAGEKTELIFHGAAGKKRLGRADVEVELLAGGRRIRIRRTLDRDGVTKLTLNGRVARFLDLDDELAGSGLGRGSLAVIGQGEVSGVLMADPSRLLAYVAEAAGVARLSGRREQTEGRLEAARGHLERLETKLADDEERLQTLRRDADDARRHDELTARGLRLRFTVALARVASLEGEVASLAEATARLEGEASAARHRIVELRAAAKLAREADAQAEAEQREATAAYARAAAEVRVAEHALEAATMRAADLERQRERTSGELAALQDQTAPVAPTDDLAGLQAEADNAAAAAELARLRREAAEADAESARDERERLEVAASQAARDAAQAETRHDGLRRQLDEVVSGLQSLEAGAGEEVANGAAPAQASAEQLERDADVALGHAESALETVRRRLESAQATHADASAEVRARQRDAARQRAAFEARRGYAEGPRHALTSAVDGVIGSLADVIRVPREVSDAIGVALGRRAEYVLTENAEVARRVLTHVRRAGGWVTLLPLDLVQGGGHDVDQRLLQEDGVIGLASRHVEADRRFASVVQQLLGGTVLVDTSARATELAGRYRRRPRLVSLEGDVLEPGGALSGGSRQRNGAVLGAAAELEEAERAAQQAEQAMTSARAEVGAAQQEHRAATDELLSARRAAGQARERAARAREAQAAERRLRDELEARKLRLEQALDELPTVPDAIPEEAVGAARRADAEARAALQSARQAEVPSAARAAETARRLVLAEERARAHQAAWARYQEDLGRAETLQRELERLETALRAAWSGAEQAESRVREARAALPDDAGATEEARAAARGALRAAEERLEEAAEQQSRIAEALEQARVLRARRETALETAQAERDRFPDGLEPLEVGERAARSAIREAELELERIGAVNHRAAQTLTELAGEHEERAREVRDARAALEQLSATLERLDRETTSRLDAAIAGVRARFVAHVSELFGDDGLGDIEVDRDEGRPTGLRIQLQPPGKRTQTLGLLSVGERTMGALAFLFAQMGEEHGTSGLPVAVLDEVDAPLDEANIRRYRSFLERLSGQGTQFVLITHQKATFEVADALWGVTTDRGVSRVFSIRKDETEPRALPLERGDGESASEPPP